MKVLPLIFSMAVSAVGGTFAVTSWAVEGNAQNVGASVLRTNRDFVSENAQSADSDRVASDGADRVGANRVAADGADRAGANRVASDGADRVGASRVAADGADHVGAGRLADTGYRTSPEVRVADAGYSDINQAATTYFCGPCR